MYASLSRRGGGGVALTIGEIEFDNSRDRIRISHVKDKGDRANVNRCQPLRWENSGIA